MCILQYVYTWTSQLRLPSIYSLSQLSPVSPHILTPSHLRSFLLHLLSTHSLITHSTLSLFTFSHLFSLAPVHSYTFISLPLNTLSSWHLLLSFSPSYSSLTLLLFLPSTIPLLFPLTLLQVPPSSSFRLLLPFTLYHL